MKPEVFIRADGNNEIGLGHLIRCMALANMLKDDFEITFVSKEIPGKIKEEINENDFRFTEIVSEKEFFKLLKPQNQIVVLDGYRFDKGYQQSVKEAGCKLVCLDDIHDREFVADLIINHAPGISREDYQATPETTFALGPEYALLRPAFLDIASQSILKKKCSILLICFGGSDVKNLTKIAAEAALNYEPIKKIMIVTGSAYKHQETLIPMIKKHEKIEYHHAVDEHEMADLMIESDTAIVPSSGILFEVLAAGITAISGLYNENQKKVYSGFKKLNAIVDAGTFRPAEITRAIEMADRLHKKKIIDGKSRIRINNLFKNL